MYSEGRKENFTDCECEMRDEKIFFLASGINIKWKTSYILYNIKSAAIWEFDTPLTWFNFFKHGDIMGLVTHC